MMQIALIAAIANHAAMGFKNKLPWHLPDDLKRFKAITLNKPVIMGRKTFDSLKKPLQQRLNIVLSRNTHPTTQDNIIYVPSFEEALQAAKAYLILTSEQEIMIAGGRDIYHLTLPFATKIYFTHIHQSVQADTYFPDIDLKNWRQIEYEQHETQTDPIIQYEYITWVKK
ncbi:MAG: dihydrofolate reductase [Endozoicomonadaceae bacterium]|nr:dihydrofolate reductase [Endozoicomonadaceae bacterium]MBE8232974.1 dihydrofolate reductase [Endozoicomonadaceae bacterium]